MLDWLGLIQFPAKDDWSLMATPNTASLSLWPDDDCAECLDTHPWPGALLFCGMCCQGIHNNAYIISITQRGKGGIQISGLKTRDPGWPCETCLAGGKVSTFCTENTWDSHLQPSGFETKSIQEMAVHAAFCVLGFRTLISYGAGHTFLEIT